MPWRDGVEVALLPLVLVFVASVTYVPHLDVAEDARSDLLRPGLVGLAQGFAEWIRGDRDDYEYTLHVDENFHWAMMAQLQRQDTLRFDEPFTGVPPGGLFGLKGTVHEKGFHLALAQFQEITGIPWLVVFRFLPAAWMAVTAWALWTLLRPWPGAPVAAALVALVPTSARLIGPAFLVPIGLGLAWVPVVALLARDTFEARRPAIPLVLALSWTFFIHFIAGLAALATVLAMLPFVRHRRRAAVLLGISLLPVLWLATSFFEELQSEATRFGFLPNQRAIFGQMGTLFLAAWVLGSLLVLYRAPQPGRSILPAFTIMAALSFSMIAINLGFRLHSYFLYERWHQPFALFATVPAAIAIMELGGWARRIPRIPGRAWAAPVAIAVLAGLAVAQPGVEGHMRERYYHVLDDADWQSFHWASASLSPAYGPFLTDPWKAPVLNALTGKRPVTVLYPGVPPLNGFVYGAYLAGANGDAPYLVEHDVTWIVAPLAPTAPEFEQIGPGVYGLRQPYLDAYNQAVQGTH